MFIFINKISVTSSLCRPRLKFMISKSMESSFLIKMVAGDKKPSKGKKVTVVGCGAVGMACAISILAQKVTTEMAIVDVSADRLKGELLDLQHGSYFLRGININASSDYAVTEDSKVCVITAGARQIGKESRLDVLHKNLDILKHVVSNLVKYSPDTIIIVATNPVDVLTHYAWKLSGLPIYKVIGSGTNLDTSRFRFLLSKHFGVAVENVHGWIIGEHGDSSVATWSNVNIAGTRLIELDPRWTSEKNLPNYRKIHAQVIRSGDKVRKLKGHTSWAIGLSVSHIIDCLLTDSRRIAAVSTLVKGNYGVEDDVFLSLPCVLGEEGIIGIVNQSLSAEEEEQFRKSAKIIFEAGKGAGLP